MDSVNVHEAKTHLSKLLKRVECGESIVIARNGKAVAVLKPAHEEPRRPIFGIDKGKFTIPPEFDDPLPEFEDL